MYVRILIVAYLIQFIDTVDFTIKDCNASDDIQELASHSYFTNTVKEETTPCRAVSYLRIPVDINYDVSVFLQSIRNSTPGIIFNVQDDENYDIVFFRTNEKVCVIAATYIHGKYQEYRRAKCRQVINPRRFFKVLVQIRNSTFNVSLDEDFGTFTFKSHHPAHPSIGFIHGLMYKYMCGFPCEFNFKQLMLNADTLTDTTDDGEFHPAKLQTRHKLQVHRIDLRNLRRFARGNTYCVIGIFFKELDLHTSKIYINDESEHTKGSVGFYYTKDDYQDIYFHMDDNSDMSAVDYTILFHVLNCDIDDKDLSFACDADKHMAEKDMTQTCYRSIQSHTPDPPDGDVTLSMGWYDLSNCAGNTIPTYSPGTNYVCTSRNPVWLKPPDSGINKFGLTNGTACVYRDKHDCAEHWDLPVYGCGGDKFLYYLVPSPNQSAYCAGDQDLCDPTLNLTAIGRSESCAACQDVCRSIYTHGHDIPGIVGVLIILLACGVVIAGFVGFVLFIKKRCRQRRIRRHYKKTGSNEELNNPLPLIQNEEEEL